MGLAIDDTVDCLRAFGVTAEADTGGGRVPGATDGRPVRAAVDEAATRLTVPWLAADPARGGVVFSVDVREAAETDRLGVSMGGRRAAPDAAREAGVDVVLREPGVDARDAPADERREAAALPGVLGASDGRGCGCQLGLRYGSCMPNSPCPTHGSRCWWRGGHVDDSDLAWAYKHSIALLAVKVLLVLD